MIHPVDVLIWALTVLIGFAILFYAFFFVVCTIALVRIIVEKDTDRTKAIDN